MLDSVLMPGVKQDIVIHDESELSAARWAVISFEKCEASGLTYDQAAAKLAELEKRKISGLSVVTDETAARVKG